MNITLRDLIKKNNANLVESFIITLNKEEVLTEYSSTYERKTLLMTAIETGNAHMVKTIITHMPPDIARIQLESLTEKTLIELALEHLPNEGLGMVIEKLKEYPDIFQRQINKHNIIQSALISSHIENILITLELMKNGKKNLKEKLGELSPEQIFELLQFYKKHLLEINDNSEKKHLIAPLCDIASLIKDSPKFTIEVKTETITALKEIALNLDPDLNQEKQSLFDTIKEIETQEIRILETKNLTMLQQQEQSIKTGQLPGSYRKH